jgi:hypothetical protein
MYYYLLGHNCHHYHNNHAITIIGVIYNVKAYNCAGFDDAS